MSPSAAATALTSSKPDEPWWRRTIELSRDSLAPRQVLTAWPRAVRVGLDELGDWLVIADFLDEVSAAAASLALAAGGVATARTTVLLTADHIAAAAQKGATYRPPGG